MPEKMTLMPAGYQDDLAYIHHTGHWHFANGAAPGLLALLRRARIHTGLVVDLGCGSGIWARHLTDAGYNVLGIDYSAPMIALARQSAPQACFQHGSYLKVDLPPCAAVTSIGECLNYLFDDATASALGRLFSRVHAALSPGGLFVFDVLEPGQLRRGETVRRHRVGDDWAVMVELDEDPTQRLLTRHITSFRQVGPLYRRSEEVHRARLHEGASWQRDWPASASRCKSGAATGSTAWAASTRSWWRGSRERRRTQNGPCVGAVRRRRWPEDPASAAFAPAGS